MSSPVKEQHEQTDIQTRFSSGLDPVAILFLILRNWYWFVIATAVALFMMRFYLSHTMRVYESSATVLIDETENRAIVDNSDLLLGLGLPGGMKNMHNQIMILRSRALVEKTLKELPFETEFYSKTIRNNLPLYPEAPIRLVFNTVNPLPPDIEFSFLYLGDDKFSCSSQDERFQFQQAANFGEVIEINGESFSIECRDYDFFKSNIDKEIFFIIHSKNSLINSFVKRLGVEQLSREGSMLKISLTGTNAQKDVDFLNKHIECFRAISLDKKNTEAQRRIQFIDDQLIGISDSLSITENKLQQFRSSHRVMDLSVQGQAIIGQVTLLENERARLNLEANYYDYLADYLTKEMSSELPIVPITMGINDPGLTRLVEELAAMQGQMSVRGAGEKNPLQRNLEQRIKSTKEALRETLNGLRRANSLAREENQQQINKANSQASALPVTERQLLGIERKFRLNDELYTFLLETRAEQEMQKASNRADSEVIDPADSRFSRLVSPNSGRLTIFALFSGFAVPFLLLFLIKVFSNKLGTDDLKGMVELPVAGSIPHNSEHSRNVVFDSPNSSIAESFRLLRSRMQFFTKEARSSVIIVTSAMPGDGKTFISINLASAYSLLGKKTVLVGFDLRKPKIIKEFNLDNSRGVSTWLIGTDNLKDIIQTTSYENLSIITAGPIPPNPSELTALEKTHELFRLLKEKFEYIIIDSSPIGVVSDTFYLTPVADACLLVVRPGKTLKDMLEYAINDISTRNTKGLSFVINDLESTNKRYGYGEKYGYTKDKARHPKSFLRRKARKSRSST